MKLTFPLLLLTATLGAQETLPIDPSDDFSPLLALMALLAILVMLIMLCICLALAVIAAICILILVALGIISTSALTGILRRKFSSGLRAFHYQACAAIAVAAGAGLAYIVSHLMNQPENLPATLAVGAAAGVCAGLAIAYIMDRAASAAISWIGRAKARRIGDTPPKASL